MTSSPLRVRCCIAGGGPTGMMLGFLLARAGISVVVLEKHADFLRDFRGDTIHPSTLEVIYELGLLDAFLAEPHQKVPLLRGWVGNTELTIADFSKLSVHCPYIAFMPQWDFLNFLARQGKKYPEFKIIMQARVETLLEENGKVTGVRAQTPEGPIEIQADLVVGADGRQSDVREKGGLKVINLGAPIDVLWMHLSRRSTDPNYSFGRFDRGKVMAMLNRIDYWQCAYVIAKGQADEIRKKGIDAFRETMAAVIPFLRDRVGELKDWDAIKLLTVRVDRLEEWCKPGLLCIGDAAHAMSPIGGVGINLAIQDAVAAANILAEPLKKGTLKTEDLRAVQRRRMFPTVWTQRFQVFAQNNIFQSALAGGGWTTLPLPFRILRQFPILTRIPARLIGVGLRPEHIRNV